MNYKLKIKNPFLLLLLFAVSIVTSNRIIAQETPATIQRDSLLSAARDYMHTARFCALVTIDSSGSPHVRTMDPFDPNENMVVYLGTNRNSRKIREIQNNPNVTLFYTQNKGVGYVSLIGTAFIIDDSAKKAELWKEEWKNFYDEQRDNYILIRIVPKRLEILNYARGITSDEKTWETPAVGFNPDNNNN